MHTVVVKLKPHLKKFALALTKNKTEPAIFPKESDWNLLLKSIVTNYHSAKSFPIKDKENSEQHFQKHSEINDSNKLIIQLPRDEHKNTSSYNYLSYNSENEFRSDLTNYYRFCFRRHLRRELAKRTQRKIAVLSFMYLYSLTENDVKFDTLYKYSTRLLKSWSRKH